MHLRWSERSQAASARRERAAAERADAAERTDAERAAAERLGKRHSLMQSSVRIAARAPTKLGALRPPPLDFLAHAADLARRFALRASGPMARALVLPRERRVASAGTLGVLTALVCALGAPLPLLALGPLIFGVPHLVADVRYLILRPRLHRQRAALVAAAVLVVGLVAGFGVRAGLASAAVAALMSGGALKRRLLVAGVALALLAAAQAAPWKADVAFFQLHNLVAIGLWLAWRPRVTRAHFVVLGCFVAATLVLAFAPLPRADDVTHWTGLSLTELAKTLSFSTNADVARRFVLFFAFAQSVHYVVWLRLIPDEDHPRSAPRSYRQSVRSLERDLGAIGCWIAVVLVLVLGAIAVVRVSLARDVYLGIAYAHGHVELFAAAFLATHARRASSAVESA